MAATFITAGAEVFVAEAAEGTTANFSPNVTGSNRFLLAAACLSNAFGAAPTIDDVFLNGLTGTSIPKIGTDELFYFDAGVGSLHGLVAPALGTINIAAQWPGTPFKGGAGGIVYEGVDPTTPYVGRTTLGGAAGDVNTLLAQMTVPDCVVGQTVAGVVFCAHDNIAISAFTGVAGTTIRAQGAGELLGLAFIEKTATASDTILEINCNAGSVGALSWRMIAVRLNDAGGPPPSMLRRIAAMNGGFPNLSGGMQ